MKSDGDGSSEHDDCDSGALLASIIDTVEGEKDFQRASRLILDQLKSQIIRGDEHRRNRLSSSVHKKAKLRVDAFVDDLRSANGQTLSSGKEFEF